MSTTLVIVASLLGLTISGMMISEGTKEGRASWVITGSISFMAILLTFAWWAAQAS